jgi:putative endonuclease
VRESYNGQRFSRKLKGAAAEQAAALYLSSQGYVILEANWRCRSGELDLIAEHGDALVFIEVRSRSGSPLQGTPEESVDIRKIRQVRNTAEVYLHMKGQEDRRISFDVISVQLNEDLSIAGLRHIREAF